MTVIFEAKNAEARSIIYMHRSNYEKLWTRIQAQTTLKIPSNYVHHIHFSEVFFSAYNISNTFIIINNKESENKHFLIANENNESEDQILENI